MSEIRATTISDAAGTGPITLTGQSAAKAWVNFNGTGTVAIRDSFNVASLNDNGIGDYTANLTSSMLNADYSSPAVASDASNVGVMGAPHANTASGIRLWSISRTDSIGFIEVGCATTTVAGDLA